MTREIFARQLIVPTVGASQIPMQVALPYAALLLEKRQGHVGFVPATAVAAGKTPTDAEIATFYSHETARYTVPERPVIRFAVVTRSEEHTSELHSLMRVSYAVFCFTTNNTTSATSYQLTPTVLQTVSQ